MVYIGRSEMLCWSVVVGTILLFLILGVAVPIIAWVMRFWNGVLHPDAGGGHYYMANQEGAAR